MQQLHKKRFTSKCDTVHNRLSNRSECWMQQNISDSPSIPFSTHLALQELETKDKGGTNISTVKWRMDGDFLCYWTCAYRSASSKCPQFYYSGLNKLLVQQWSLKIAQEGHGSSEFHQEAHIQMFQGEAWRKFLSWLQSRQNAVDGKWSTGVTRHSGSTAVSTFLENDFGHEV